MANKTVNRSVTRAFVNRKFSRPPIILGGCPRSGTTLLLSILGSHPNILAIDYETTAFHPSLKPLRLLNGLLFTERNKRITGKEKATRFCEKTPGNVRHVEEIDKFFDGKVCFINIMRDGRDVVTSIHPENKSEYLVSPDVWLWDMRNILDAEKRDNVCTIKYEDLVGETAGTLKRICEFLDEPFLDEMLDYQRNTNVKDANAWDSKAKPIHQQSIKKWERPEHTQRVNEFMANSKAVDMLERLGYA